MGGIYCPTQGEQKENKKYNSWPDGKGIMSF